uniref:hypothetical protein n=1 Tax=Candidatus Cryptobacteroides bacterium TaxID=3085639 RepID=UPI003FF1113C
MDRNEIIEELRREIAEIKSRVAVLEDKLAALENDKADSVEHIDLEQENILPDIAEIADVAVPVEAPIVEPAVEEVEVKPVAEDIEDMPEETVVPAGETAEEIESQEIDDAPEADVQDNAGDDLPGDDGGSLFGGFGEVEPALAKTRSVKTVNDANSSRVHKTIGESHTGTRAWLTDMPGSEVKDVRSAISLNDRVMFISSLFREDSMLFQDVVSKINSQTSIDKVVSYLEETFPEWNMDSELVYRFMMAVRRKIR